MATATLEATPQAKTRRRKRDELLLLALLLLSDSIDGVILWDTYAPRPYRGLLLARPFDNVREQDGALPLFWFDVETQRYGTGRRGFIQQAALFGAIDAFTDALSNRAADSVRQVYHGGDLAEWQAQMEQQARATAMAATALGIGGVERLTEDALAKASKGLLFPLERLDRFARQIEAGVVTEDQAARRGAMYPPTVMSGEGGFDGARRDSHKAATFTLERNILAVDADHCLPTGGLPGCVEVTELGWQKIGTIPLPGRRACLMNCRCKMEFSRGRLDTATGEIIE